MAGEREIIESINAIANPRKLIGSKVEASVTSVDLLGRTCSATTITDDSEIEMTGIRLMAEVNDGMLLVPKVGSTIIVDYSNTVAPFVLLFSELDMLWMVADKIKLNDGSFEGLVKVVELTNKLNILENKYNSFIATFNTHIHTGVTTGPGASAITPTQIIGNITPTQKKDIQNPKITHGA